MMSLASILERRWKLWTGKGVSGFPGTLWVATWWLIWGLETVDA